MISAMFPSFESIALHAAFPHVDVPSLGLLRDCWWVQDRLMKRIQHPSRARTLLLGAQSVSRSGETCSWGTCSAWQPRTALPACPPMLCLLWLLPCQARA